MRARRPCGWLLVLAIGLLGCAEAEYAGTKSAATPAADRGNALIETVLPTSAMYEPTALAKADRAAPLPPSSPAGAAGSETPAPPPDTTGLQRKIIYNADIGLIVEDFATAESQIARMVQATGGYIAEMQILGSPGSRRSARWRVRIPVEKFETFLRDVAGLGELESSHRTSEDVTEKFYDLEARIKNKKTEEERLIQILKETTGKLEDVLKIETELSRVRGEVEQMEGAMRLLTNLTALTTVTITIRERESFQPPPPAAPAFATRVSRAFHSSLEALIDLGEAVVLFAVRNVLWIPIYLLAALLTWLAVRWFLRALIRMARRAWEVGRTPVGRLVARPASTAAAPGTDDPGRVP